jgi:hypothetical protein
MKKRVLFFTMILAFAMAFGQAIPVKVVQTVDNGWQLLRNGKPYHVKGVGGSGSKVQLAAAGANTFRTWGVDEDLKDQLDEAHKLGLAVVVGHWLGHPRHGFDYSDKKSVAEQFARVKRDVLRYKDHPAVLFWGIGNEMEGFAEGDDPNVWNHVQAIAAMIKKVDPNHPTMTVTAEIGGKRVEMVHKYCPDIDIMGINSYGGSPSLVERYLEIGGTKPMVITEFGPPGVWEIQKTAFGAPPELTSTQKADIYRKIYKDGILAYPGVCLGGFAFIWGSKMEATATWFGMLLPGGEKLAAVDVMTTLWSGQPPANLSPQIHKFALRGADVVAAKTPVHIDMEISDPESDPLDIHWEVRGEVNKYITGGDVQPTPVSLTGVVTSASAGGATLVFPGGGLFRVYMTAYDGKGSAATANVPIKVTGPPGQVQVKLPVYVYADGQAQPWSPSGWMGNTSKLKLNYESKHNPRNGLTCIEVNYDAYDGWAGIAWQHPVDDWGDLPGGYNLSGATKLTFWARGKYGGEAISFAVGIIKNDKPYFDTAFAERKDVELTKKWRQYSIPLSGKDLSRIKTPFVWTLASKGMPVVFYLDDIRFE